MKTIIAIDVSNFAYKEYFGGSGDVASRIVAKALAIQKKTPEGYVYLAYDCEGKTFRHELYPGYKAGRVDDDHKKAVGDAIRQTKQYAHNAGLQALEFAGYEADDVIASLARQCRVRGERVVVASADKDMYSLLQFDGVTVYKFISVIGVDREAGGLLVKLVDQVTADDVRSRYVVEPFQWTDFRCMTGDPSDNIAGLEGYGPKKAAMILQAYDSLQIMYADWSTNRQYFADKDAEKFDGFRQSLPLLQQLFTMNDSLDVIRH